MHSNLPFVSHLGENSTYQFGLLVLYYYSHFDNDNPMYLLTFFLSKYRQMTWDYLIGWTIDKEYPCSKPLVPRSDVSPRCLSGGCCSAWRPWPGCCSHWCSLCRCLLCYHWPAAGDCYQLRGQQVWPVRPGPVGSPAWAQGNVSNPAVTE